MIIQEILQKNIINFLFYEFEIKHKIKTNPEKPLKNQSQKPFRKSIPKTISKRRGCRGTLVLRSSLLRKSTFHKHPLFQVQS